MKCVLVSSDCCWVSISYIFATTTWSDGTGLPSATKTSHRGTLSTVDGLGCQFGALLENSAPESIHSSNVFSSLIGLLFQFCFSHRNFLRRPSYGS
jgi:hypothetical protein